MLGQKIGRLGAVVIGAQVDRNAAFMHLWVEREVRPVRR